MLPIIKDHKWNIEADIIIFNNNNYYFNCLMSE